MAIRLGGLLHLREGGKEALKGVAAAKESRRQHVRLFMFVHVENGAPSLVIDGLYRRMQRLYRQCVQL